MGGGGIYVAQGYAGFSGAKYAENEDLRSLYAAVEQMLESSSIADVRSAFTQLNKNEIFRYGKAGYKVYAGLEQTKSAVIVFLLPDPLLTNEIAAVQLLGLGISNIVIGIFQIIERLINE